MDLNYFIDNYREAFGENTGLPLAFWYSDHAVADTEKSGGCMFKSVAQARKGLSVSLNAQNIGCGGGKFYCGFTPMPPFVPEFVSLKERYKESPELVKHMIEKLNVPQAVGTYLNFTRVDNLNSLDGVEGLLFFASPDVLSGLVTWASFDLKEEDAVCSLFGSGCSNVVTQAVVENRKGGYRTFIGFFDPSVRPYFESNILSFTVPLSRFRVMYDTMRRSCLFEAHGWSLIRDRIIKDKA